MNAVIYARFSSHNQTEQSIEGQLRVCHDFAIQNGYKVVNEYIDRAMTGTNDKRTAFQEMLKDSAKKEWSYVLVYKIDRFGRNKFEIAMNKHTLKQNGIKLISAMENIPDTPEGIILESVLEGMAEYYSADLSQKVKRGMRESIIKKNFLGGTIPLGYKIIDKKFVIDEDKAEIIKYIFNSYANGMSIKDITCHLNNNGHKNSRNKYFLPNSVTKILKNKKYIGTLTYANEEIEDYCPTIIEKPLFDKVQACLNKNKHYHPKRDIKESFILSGRIYCGYCGNPIIGVCGTSRSLKRHSYYVCTKNRKEHNCLKTTEQKDKLENEIIETAIFKIKKNKKTIIKNVYELNKKLTQDERLNVIRKKIDKINKDLDKIFEQFLETKNKEIIERLNAKANDLSLQKEDTINELKKLEILNKTQITQEYIETQINKMIKTETLQTTEQKQKFINTFINSIYLFNDKTFVYINTDDENKPITFKTVNEDLSIISSKNNGSPVNDLGLPKLAFLR